MQTPVDGYLGIARCPSGTAVDYEIAGALVRPRTVDMTVGVNRMICKYTLVTRPGMTFPSYDGERFSERRSHN